MQIMRADAPPGMKVSFTGVGFHTEVEVAKKYLTVNKMYTVKDMQEDGGKMMVILKEINGRKFNSVMFSECY